MYQRSVVRSGGVSTRLADQALAVFEENTHTETGTESATWADEERRRLLVSHICDLFVNVAHESEQRKVSVKRRAMNASGEVLFRWIDSPEIPEHERRVYRDEFRARAYRSDEPTRKPQPPKLEASGFDERTLELIQWLQELIDSGEIDTVDPFPLRPAVRVEHPRKMAEALLRDLECPDSPRCRNRVAQRDLQDFFQRIRHTGDGISTKGPSGDNFAGEEDSRT